MRALVDVMLNQAQVKMGVPNNDGQSLKPSLYTKKNSSTININDNKYIYQHPETIEICSIKQIWSGIYFLAHPTYQVDYISVVSLG